MTKSAGRRARLTKKQNLSTSPSPPTLVRARVVKAPKVVLTTSSTAVPKEVKTLAAKTASTAVRAKTSTVERALAT